MTAFKPTSAASGVRRAIEIHVKSRAWRFDMKALSKTFVLLLAAFGLASCGGGGGGSQGAFQPTPSDTISISASSTSITTNNFSTLTVTVMKHDGTIENDGTQVTASVTPATMGSVSGAGTGGATATNTLAGGHTTFLFTSGNQTGTATVTMSLQANTNGSPTATSASIPITVTAGTSQDPRLQFSQSNASLPVSPYDFAAQQAAPFPGNFLGSPYVSEVVVTWRHTGGQLIDAGSINVSVSPSTVALFSTNAETLTTFHTLKSSGSVTVTGGATSIFVHSGNVPGTATLTVSATDPDSNQTISSQLQITVAGSGSTLPSSITAASSGAAYVSGSGGPQSALVTFKVTDGSNGLIADPAGFDNVQIQIAGPAGTDVVLRGVNAAGQSVSGSIINTVTHNGIASVTVQAGTQQGPVQIKATTDRGDGNVDNDIQDPVSATATVIVSDGKLFSLTLSEPALNAILANKVSTDTTATGTLPADPNATYSFTVSATGVDRQGNPVLPGTVIKFGSIDAPLIDTQFAISGIQGNPQEGGTFFTATDGHFRTAGGGAGPGDTVIVFGKLVTGNADLESASKVSKVTADVSLNVTTPFNLNDTTGVTVDNGFVLPYVVGRATTGNILSPALTNNFGTASTTLNYPVSALGRTVAVWAQSNSTDTVTGGTNIVTDADIIVFPGIAPAKIIISPSPIPGNLTIEVDACIQDALQSPISGVRFNFSFQNLGVGSGKLDGISTAGIVPDATGPNGCVATSVFTTGISGNTTGETAPNLTFSIGDTTAFANIVASGNLILIAKPSALGGDGGTVTLTLLNSNGTPVPGVQLVGTCTGDPSIGIKSGPGVTGADGSTTAVIQAALNGIHAGKTGSCTFTTSTGSPSAVVTLQGIDLCLVSPHPTSCDSP
jgi:hypothetical protein